MPRTPSTLSPEELVLVDRKSGADGGVERRRVVAGGDRRPRQAEGVRRIAEGDESVGAARLGGVDELPEVLGRDRVALVHDQLEAGRLERRTGGTESSMPKASATLTIAILLLILPALLSLVSTSTSALAPIVEVPSIQNELGQRCAISYAWSVAAVAAMCG